MDMALDDIRKVTQAEQEGQQLREQAAAAARQTAAQAEREGRQLLEDARNDAYAKAKDLMEQAEQDAAARTARVLDEARQDCDELIRAARANLDKAAALIAERVVRE